MFGTKDEKDGKEIVVAKVLLKLESGYYFYTITSKDENTPLMIGSYYLVKLRE